MTVTEGDCLAVMPTLDAESVDAIVTDPPYGLGFMGKAWDHGVPGSPFWIEALRVAKPGAHLVAFGGTRTYHRLAVAIEDAGWEIRDGLMWLYGSGFPKSLDVSKAIDKAHGAERAVVESRGATPRQAMAGGFSGEYTAREASPLPARQWQGWGTALKPAWEPIILARRPFRATVAANVQEHGTGALNIDACRLAASGEAQIQGAYSRISAVPIAGARDSGKVYGADLGRWPANVVLDEDAARELDAQSGELTSGARSGRRTQPKTKTAYGSFALRDEAASEGDSGGASRFFYTAKAARSEREAGLDALAKKPGGSNAKGYVDDVARGQDRNRPVANHHPTVKPLDLMQWLCRLVTPKGGLILDPFCGSGTTGRAAVAEGFRFLGIELSPEYAAIARARIREYAPLFAEGAD